VPRIADWCSLDLVEADGSLRRVEVAHSDPERESLAREVYRRYPADTSNTKPYALGLLRGEPILVPDFSESVLREISRDAEHQALLRGFGIRSVMCVPMMNRKRLVGLLTLATAESGRRFGQEDVSLVRSLADRAALAIDNARLFGEAKAVARAREEAVATVSHDLRGPLAVALTNLALIRENGVGDDDRERALRRTERALGGMHRMIGDLLDVARLEAGALGVSPAPVAVDQLLAEARELVGPDAQTLALRLKLAAEEGLTALADRDGILRVLGNLLENAVRHSPQGAEIRLEARGQGDRVVIRVQDEGPGVPAEVRERIFMRYWQSGSGRRQGAGLGLAISRALVELHGGRIWVECPESGGACFAFTLPRHLGRPS
jgi:signal transduction histidine kinase